VHFCLCMYACTLTHLCFLPIRHLGVVILTHDCHEQESCSKAIGEAQPGGTQIKLGGDTDLVRPSGSCTGMPPKHAFENFCDQFSIGRLAIDTCCGGSFVLLVKV
jgi:hypothetical protein